MAIARYALEEIRIHEFPRRVIIKLYKMSSI